MLISARRCPGVTRLVTNLITCICPQLSASQENRLESLTELGHLPIRAHTAHLGRWGMQLGSTSHPAVLACHLVEGVRQCRALESRYTARLPCICVNPQLVSATHRTAAAEETVCTFYKAGCLPRHVLSVCLQHLHGQRKRPSRGQLAVTNRTQGTGVVKGWPTCIREPVLVQLDSPASPSTHAVIGLM